MPFKRNNRPWNRGLRGLEAGWTPERRQRASELQRERILEDPDKYHIMHRSGPQPDTWITGPDPEIKEHRLRWSRARAQARFWRQEWSILWEDYLDIYKTAPGRWGGRDGDALHLARRDTAEGWHIWNVHLVNRGQSMRRSTRGKKRIRPAGLGSKQKGINWRKKDDTRTED